MMNETLFQLLESLLSYAENAGLTDPRDRTFHRNSLLAAFGQDDWAMPDGMNAPEPRTLQGLLDALCDEAVKRGLIPDGTAAHDLFDTQLMGLLTPLPSTVEDAFSALYADSPDRATDYLYALSGACNYIRTERVAKDLRWTYDGKYGTLDITINLSKPEKDPRAIAAALKAGEKAYPACQLCPSNVGYRGRLDHPARQNLRTVPLRLHGEPWRMQYSPYVYYSEHCIVLREEHVPMRITEDTFARLLDFVTLFPSYFLGSNADLPIVGGSILTHDHFQGGRYCFAMERAQTLDGFTVGGYEDVTAERLLWPLSVLRLTGARERVEQLACHVLRAWRGYTDEACQILAETDGAPHNTITPIARRAGDAFQLDLVLRNNLTTPEHPMGLYHPHAEKHHIKKENIGLIEVMGLAVLPARLKGELQELTDRFLHGLPPDTPQTAPHAAWFAEVLARRTELQASPTEETVRRVLFDEVGRVFEAVLEDAGVYRCDQAGRDGFARFMRSLQA